ncbi:MAG TPA: hypothetical protein VK195_09035, partial [Burkholderiaceae bacterium]|nr:hypothetical protein [Burkholderiaceae bacterium]
VDAGSLEGRAHLSATDVDAHGRLRSGFDMAAWREAVRQDRSVFGSLVGPQFDSTQIVVFLPEDYSEQGVVDRVARYLEKREISQLEWLLFKGDIRPVAEYANVSLGGWSVARGLMHYALISDVMFYSTVGLVIATLAAMLALRSWRQALQVSGVIFASFVIVRGLIPLMADLGLSFWGQPVYERVYFLLVLSALIVSGISLNVRAFEAYNEAWAAHPGLDRAALWRLVAPIRHKFNVVVFIAFLNFATLPQIGIRGILEVGVLSALGVLVQRVLVSTLLPALHLCVGGCPADAGTDTKASRWGRISQAVEHSLRRVPEAAHGLLARLSPRGSLLLSLSVTGLALAGAAVVVVHDMRSTRPWIAVQERPIDYLPHTIVDRGRAVLNRPGGAGFARLSFLVLPAQPREGVVAMDDPAFLASARALQLRLQALPGAMPVQSILDKLSQMSQRSPDIGQPLPQTRQQAHELLQLIRWDLENPRLAPYFWSDEGLVVFAAHAADNSRELRLFAEEVMAAARDFPELRVLPFGRLHTYHQTDAYISQGKPINVLSSFPLVVGVCFAWLAWRQRRRPGHPASRRQRLHPLWTAMAISLPFVFAYALIVVLMAALSLPLDQATACATALGINAAIDFDIYLVDDFLHALRRGATPDEALREALAERGHVTLIDALLNGICFSFLMLSPFLPIQRLGFLMIVMLAACAFGALVLMAGVLRACVRPALETAVEDPALARFFASRLPEEPAVGPDAEPDADTLGAAPGQSPETATATATPPTAEPTPLALATTATTAAAE